MRWKYKKLLEVVGLRPRAPPPRVFVSLNVFDSHRPSRLSQPSTRVIVRVSIWTLLVLLLAFIVIYTILLLVYVDNNYLQSRSMHDFHDRNRKTKLKGKFKMHSNRLIGDLSDSKVENFDVLHRKTMWNSSKFYSDDIKLPQCEWQVVFRILVLSTPNSRSQRMAIRDTWCNPERFGVKSNKWHCIFLIGLTHNETLNREIRREKEEHNDILVGKYLDSYENLTLKVIHGFNWSANYCPSSFVLKTDQDCFVNAEQLYTFLLHYNQVTQNLYAGSVLTDKRMLKVKRYKNKKWYVPYEDFAEEYYYPYASGMGYIMSTDVAKKLVRESAFNKPIVNEDAYVGIVMHQLSIEPIYSSRFVLSPSGLNVCNFRYMFVIHDVPPEQQEYLLQKSLRAAKECLHHKVITTWS